MAGKKTQFKPGQSGNPKGRPPTVKCIPNILSKIGAEVSGGTRKMTKLEIILRKVYTYAREGQPWAVHFIADRTEGKALEHIEHSGEITDGHQESVADRVAARTAEYVKGVRHAKTKAKRKPTKRKG